MCALCKEFPNSNTHRDTHTPAPSCGAPMHKFLHTHTEVVAVIRIGKVTLEMWLVADYQLPYLKLNQLCNYFDYFIKVM